MTEQPRFKGPDGIEVQAISLDGRSEYRVREHGIWRYLSRDGKGERHNPRTLAELAELVDISTLELVA